MKPPRVKYLPAAKCYLVAGKFPNFSRTGSISGMRRKFYGNAALLVRCRGYIYNVSERPEIYHTEAK